MRTIIAGSRKLNNIQYVINAVRKSKFNITVVISGGAKGIDRQGENYAHIHDIPVEQFLADWDTLGNRAGYVRNETMAQNAEALIAIWDGKSQGTKHMINIAKKYKLKIFILHIKNTD